MNRDGHGWKARAPAFWKVAPGVVWIQVHTPEQAKKLGRIAGARRVAYSVAGPYLRTFEFARPVAWAERWVKREMSRERGTNEAFLVPGGCRTNRTSQAGRTRGCEPLIDADER